MIFHELSFNIKNYERSLGNVIKRDTFSTGFSHVASYVILDKCNIKIFIMAV